MLKAQNTKLMPWTDRLILWSEGFSIRLLMVFMNHVMASEENSNAPIFFRAAQQTEADFLARL